jgi:hypothetical protein
MAWEVIQYAVAREASKPAPANLSVLRIALDQVPTNYVWLVSGIAVMCPSSERVPCLVYDVDPDSNGVPCAGTGAGNLDFDDGCTLIIPGGAAMTLEWIGVDVGITAKCRVQYAVAQETGASTAKPIL